MPVNPAQSVPGDSELLGRAVAGEPLALERLLVREQSALARRIQSRLPRTLAQTVGVEDILQETYSLVFRRISEFVPVGPGAFRRWVTTIADNNNQYRAVFTNTAGSGTSSAAILTVNKATINNNGTVLWGTSGTVAVATAGDGLRLLPTGRTLTLVRVFAAPRDLVWTAYTDPAHITKWLFANDWESPLAESDLRVGGTFRSGMRPADHSHDGSHQSRHCESRRFCRHGVAQKSLDSG